MTWDPVIGHVRTRLPRSCDGGPIKRVAAVWRSDMGSGGTEPIPGIQYLISYIAMMKVLQTMVK